MSGANISTPCPLVGVMFPSNWAPLNSLSPATVLVPLTVVPPVMFILPVPVILLLFKSKLPPS